MFRKKQDAFGYERNVPAAVPLWWWLMDFSWEKVRGDWRSQCARAIVTVAFVDYDDMSL